MTPTTTNTLDRLLSLAEYIIHCPKEREDYLNHCDDNDLNPNNVDNDHIYSIALSVFNDLSGRTQ